MMKHRLLVAMLGVGVGWMVAGTVSLITPAVFCTPQPIGPGAMFLLGCIMSVLVALLAAVVIVDHKKLEDNR